MRYKIKKVKCRPLLCVSFYAQQQFFVKKIVELLCSNSENILNRFKSNDDMKYNTGLVNIIQI